MKSFNQFLTICEAIYDRDKKSDVDLEVGKIGKERRRLHLKDVGLRQ